MKLKIPKSIYLSGKLWRVVTNNKEGGGWFDGGKATISIGTKYPQDVEDIFIHEILEAILVERKYRYQLSRNRCDNGDLIFIFNHKEFENICADLAFALFHKDNPVLRKRKRQ